MNAIAESMQPAAATALACRGLVKRYGSLTAVDGLSLEVRAGECFGLLGPNGAGKTTTLEILEGLIPPDQGQVEILGSGWGRGEDDRLRQRLGVQLQETHLPGKLTVEEVVRLFRSFVRHGRGIGELIRLVGLEEKRGARVETLSAGQRQRLSLACVLIGDPELIFLDEPTTGLDPQSRRSLWEFVEDVLKGGTTILLTTHYMDEAARLCDRVAVLDRGQVIALDTPEALIASLGAEQVIAFEAQGQVDLEALRRLPGLLDLKQNGSGFLLNVSRLETTLPALFTEVARQRLRLESLSTHRATLEDVFVKLTGRALRDG